MGEVQLWQAEDLGTDKETLERVLHVFRSDGVQGMKSQQSLESYIKGLDNDSLRNMYEIDGEATIQILVDCFGAILRRKIQRMARRNFKDSYQHSEKGKRNSRTGSGSKPHCIAENTG